MNVSKFNKRIVIRGAGEVASGVIYRLSNAGYEVIALEVSAPICVRRYVCYANAIFHKSITIEGVTAKHSNSVAHASKIIKSGSIPVLIDPDAKYLSALNPIALIDARMLKINIDTSLNQAPIVIGLGPGFAAGDNCHAVVETNRGPKLGEIIYSGAAQNDTGIPAPVNGYDRQRVIYSPANGIFSSQVKITEKVKSGQSLGEVAGVPVISELDGMVRGLINDGIVVSENQKIGDIDPRSIKENCFKISGKSKSIANGVLGALQALSESLKKT